MANETRFLFRHKGDWYKVPAGNVAQGVARVMLQIAGEGEERMRAGSARFLCVALLGCCALLLPRPAGAASADEVYTVGNYPVDAQAANAVAAKEQALADGQQAAFRSLLKRLVPVTAYKQLSRVASLKAGDLISGVAVRSERNSSTDYIANLDFSFQADAIRAAL